MSEYSIGQAINLLLEKSGWKTKVHELRMRNEWEAIVGKTIAKYTSDIHLSNRVLTIRTDIAPLKQELQLAKEQLINQINEYFSETVLLDIVVR